MPEIGEESRAGNPSDAPRAPAEDLPEIFLLGDLRIDVARGEIHDGDEERPLGGQPLEILSALLHSPSHTVDREELKDRLWPDGRFGDLDQRLNAAVRLLRRSLGDSFEEPRYLETLRGRGHRLCAPVRAIHRESRDVPPARVRRPVTPLLLVLGLVMTAFLMAHRMRHREARAPGILRLALAPIETIGEDSDLAIRAAILDEELTTRLARWAPDRIELVGGDSSARLAADRDLDLGRPVDLLLEGRLTGEPSSARLFLHLHDMRRERVAWSSETPVSLPTTLWFPELASALASLSGVSPELPAGPDPGTSVPQSYEHVLRAAAALDAKDPSAARIHLEQALVLDPEYVHAHVLLGRTLWSLARSEVSPPAEKLRPAEDSFRRALELDPELADAHLDLAQLLFYGQWDWKRAEASYLEALRTGPGRADTHHAYAWFLLASRRFEEAEATMARALELDPLAALLHSHLGWFHYRMRDYKSALTSCHVALELDDELRSALDCRHRSLARLGKFDQALARGLELSEVPDDVREGLLSGAPDAGYRGYLRYLDSQPDLRGSPLVRAMNLAAAERPAEALARLEEARVRHDELLVLIDVTPEFDQLAAEPSFQAIRRDVLGGR